MHSSDVYHEPFRGNAGKQSGIKEVVDFRFPTTNQTSQWQLWRLSNRVPMALQAMVSYAGIDVGKWRHNETGGDVLAGSHYDRCRYIR
jgi:hypothetical protein